MISRPRMASPMIDLCASDTSDDDAGGSADPSVVAFRDATWATSSVLTDVDIAAFIAHCSSNVNAAVNQFFDISASGIGHILAAGVATQRKLHRCQSRTTTITGRSGWYVEPTNCMTWATRSR